MAWIIETNSRDWPIYWACTRDDAWSSDPRKAIQFARLKDAERVIAFDFPKHARAVEYVEEWPEAVEHGENE